MNLIILKARGSSKPPLEKDMKLADFGTLFKFLYEVIKLGDLLYFKNIIRFYLVNLTKF